MSRYFWIGLCLLIFLSGCVHRRVTITSEPLGALVRLDGEDIGYTPASADFTWYGTREVQLLKDGYETRTEQIDVETPWYQVFPLDFISDNFLGTHTTDHRRFHFRMQPATRSDSRDTLNRARNLRSEALHGR